VAKVFTPLAPNVPIVDEEGNPTPYFQRIMQELSDAKISESLLAALGGDPGEDAVLAWDDTADAIEFVPNDELLSLDDLTDVDTSTTPPTDGQALVWVDADSEWAPGDVAASGGGGFTYEAGPPTPPTTSLLSTWDNQGTSTVTDGAQALILKPQLDAITHGRYMTAPATPYDVYCRLEVNVLSTTSSTTSIDIRAGIMFKDTAGDNERLVFSVCQQRASGDENVLYPTVLERWTGASPPVSSSTALVTYDSTPWKWMRVNNSGTVLTFYVSKDGIDWLTVGTESLATHIDGAASVGVAARASANDTQATVYFSYFSFNPPVITTPTVPTVNATEVLLSTQTVSNSSSPVVFDSSLITSTYKRYKVLYYGVYGSTGIPTLGLQFSPDNGTTWRTTSYTGSRTIWNVNSTFTAKNNTGTTFCPVVNDMTVDSTYPAFGEIHLQDPTNSGLKELVYGRGITKAASDSNRYEYICSGEYTTAEAHNAIRFILSAGNLTGTFKLYGIL
jgi:hypothetical protein